MRIVCEQCSAAFSVDETKVPEAGARATCPKCGRTLIVRRPPPTGPGFLQPPDTVPPVGAPVPPDPLAFSTGEGISLPSGRFSAPLPPDPLERDGHTTGRYAVPDAAAAAYASAAGRITQQPSEQPLSTTPAPWIPGLDEPFGFQSSPGTPAHTTQPKPLDPFAFDDAPPAPEPARERTPGPAAAAAVAATPPSDEWRVKRAGGVVEGPFTAKELLARFEAGLVDPQDLVAQGDGSFQPLSAHSLTSSFLRAKSERKVKAFASTGTRSGRTRFAAAAGALAAGLVVGALVFTVRPAFLFGAPPAPADRAALAIIDEWKRNEPRPIANAQELYQLGKGYLQNDTRVELRRAADVFRRALLRDARDVRSMAAYAEARGILSVEDGDETGVRESSELLAYALRHAGTEAAPYIARANLLARTGTAGDLLVAQQAAEQGRRYAPEDPDALLAVGRAFTMSNPEFALENIEKARKKEGVERRALLLLGEVLLRMGRIGEARAALEKRAAEVPEDPSADLRLAELDVSLGAFEEARARLERVSTANPRSAETRLVLAHLAYQIDGDLPRARTLLEEASKLALDKKRKLRLAVHKAAVAHLSGALEEAAAAVKEGLDVDGESSPLRFRQALLALEAGRTDDALAELKKAADGMPDRAQRAITEGRIRLVRGETDLAQAQFSRASMLEPHRIEPYLLGAAMYAQVGAQTQALTYARRALQADPAWASSRRALHEYVEPPYVGQVLGGLATLVSARQEIALTQGALAMARYHAGDKAGAEEAAEASVRAGASVTARVYRAQLALDRGEPLAALDEAKIALQIDPHCPLAHHLAGVALLALGRYEEAHAKLRDAVDEDPNFFPAQVRDAEALLKLGQNAEAKAQFTRIHRSRPEDLFVRRGLDALVRDQAAGSPPVAGTPSTPE